MAKRGPVATQGARGAATSLESPATARELPAANTYSERTRRWWATWASSPQASKFHETDWQRLEMLAPLVDLYFGNPDRQLMAEIRQNEAKLGATPEDRERLRWKIEEPQVPSADEPARKSSRARKDPLSDARLIVPPLDAEPYPTLGWGSRATGSKNLVHGPGDILGEPAKSMMNSHSSSYRAYEVFPRGHELAGRRRFKRVVLSRRKGVR
jgi:hypothetical protein